MKKVFVTFLAVASVIACTKSNVEFEETTEIGLKPVAHNVTKSMMTGESFATSESFNVWAFYKQLPAGTTIEAVAALEAGGFRNTVISAQRACSQKSRDMSSK